MKRNLIMLIILVLFGGTAWIYQTYVYKKYPSRIRNLDRTIQLRDEKLISAQIIHQELDLVAKLIERNIALSKSDSLAEHASMPFMESITDIMKEQEVKLVKLEPGKTSARLDYVRTPYTLTVETSFIKLGKFINQLEKSERLITVERLEIDNAVRKSGSQAEKGDISAKAMVLRISTLTLIKQR